MKIPLNPYWLMAQTSPEPGVPCSAGPSAARPERPLSWGLTGAFHAGNGWVAGGMGEFHSYEMDHSLVPCVNSTSNLVNPMVGMVNITRVFMKFINLDLGVSRNGAYPNSWLVDFMENPI